MTPANLDAYIASEDLKQALAEHSGALQRHQSSPYNPNLERELEAAKAKLQAAASAMRRELDRLSC